MLKFYALPVSSYCCKVRIVLRLKNIEFEEFPPLGGSYASAEWKSYMPPGSIPAIEQDGFKLFDSEAIVEYLDDLIVDPPLRSADLEVRARQRAISQFHNTRLEPTVRKLFPLVKLQKDESITEQLGQLRSEFIAQLDSLCGISKFTPYISGSSLSLSDCGFPASIMMSKDIFKRLSIDFDLPESISNWLGLLQENPVIGDEIAKNRRAVADWMGQFR